MNKQHGFSLIEALVALVILSFGLIGVAAMQLKALQSATAGYQRSVATLAAVDAQERLWATLAQLPSGQSCSDIDKSSAVILQGDLDNPGWEDYWFGSDDEESETPIRHLSGTVMDHTDDVELEPCTFRIVITLDENPGDITTDNFIYTFRLPDFSES